MTIFLIRHGRTLANEQHLYCGSPDLPLSRAGREALANRPPIDVGTAHFITSSKLTTVAESDLNTRLHNRNAYENRLRDYPLRCSNSLTCVYIDVNGLHELNNTYGHEEGDKMLRTVACILREIFGEEDSYRIGGDEFVAFALDSTDTELNENMEQFVRQVEEAGYSVAVGTASHSAGGIDIDALVKKAEQRMYLDKSRHYEQLRRGTEE